MSPEVKVSNFGLSSASRGISVWGSTPGSGEGLEGGRQLSRGGMGEHIYGCQEQIWVRGI